MRDSSGKDPSTTLRAVPLPGKSRGERGGRPRLMGGEAIGRFLDAVQRGEKLEAAAKAGGFALSAFYWRRRRDAGFDAEWNQAARIAALRFGKARRRPRFSARRREAYLDHLAACCDTNAAAAEAGVHRSAVYRRIARDPAFARDNEEALRRGYERLEVEARLEREAAAERWRDYAIEPTGWPTQDFDEQMRLLARYWRPPPRRRDRWRRPPMSLDELVDDLETKLSRRFGLPR